MIVKKPILSVNVTLSPKYGYDVVSMNKGSYELWFLKNTGLALVQKTFRNLFLSLPDVFVVASKILGSKNFLKA